MRASLLVLAACHATASTRAPNVAALDPAQLEKDTKYLASDDLEGRAPGTPGGTKAEEYIAERYRAIGLSPAGDHGTYFQDVPLREATLVDSSLVIHAAAGDLALEQKRNMFVRGYARDPDVRIEGPLAFVGFGIARADLGYDDVGDVDLHGKIAVLYGGAPTSIAGKPLDPALHAALSTLGTRTYALRDRGAVAVLVIYDHSFAQRFPFAEFAVKVPTTGMAWLSAGEPGEYPVLPMATITEDAFATIVGRDTQDVWRGLDRGEKPALVLAASAALHVKSALRDMAARNIVGLVRGTDRADEYIAYSAHHDHLGRGAPVNGDPIYNGALDNAIGVAAMLEVAHAIRQAPPRRSVLFVAVTGEELGMLGSEYFAAHPPVPVGNIVANFNIDGVTPNYEVHDIVALGADHSTLGGAAESAARAAGLVLSPDPDPAQVYFIRSDQFSFVKVGIPAMFASAGWMDASGKRDGNKAAQDAWTQSHYHQPADQWEASYRPEWTLPELRFHLLVGLAVANADTRPHWNPGDPLAHVANPAARRDSPQPVSPGVDGSAKAR